MTGTMIEPRLGTIDAGPRHGRAGALFLARLARERPAEFAARTRAFLGAVARETRRRPGAAIAAAAMRS